MKINDNDQIQTKVDLGLRPFRLVKYFSFSSLGVMMIFSLLLSWVISNHARNIILDQREEYSILIAENLNRQVFRSFVLPTIVRYGRIALSDQEQSKQLDKIINSAIQGLKIESVSIYDSSTNIVSYSTINNLIGRKNQGGDEYKKALTGISNSRIITTGTVLNNLPWFSKIGARLNTFVPFRLVRETGVSSNIIMGVIEIEQDLSSDYEAIIKLQGKILLVSTFIMFILFLILRGIISRADKIITRRAAERLVMEEKLQNSKRLAHLGRMVATVSHEIKSPLGIVRSTAEILNSRIKKIAPGSENLSLIIIDETTRLNNIVMEFLDFARPQVPQKNNYDLKELIDKVLIFVSPKLKANNINLEKKIISEPAIVNIDPDMFYRVILNIIVNAIQAMQEGGRLTVGLKASVEEFHLEICDTGKGIAEEKIDQIFKPFFTDKHKGTGLGLAISKNIVENHGGIILVDSDGKKGSKFTIKLPAARVGN